MIFNVRAGCSVEMWPAAAGSGVLGAVVGAGATLVAGGERRRTQRARLVGALAAFATALDLLVAELRRTTPHRPWLGPFPRWLDQHRPELRWLSTHSTGLSTHSTGSCLLGRAR
jgi:hypothetical protein